MKFNQIELNWSPTITWPWKNETITRTLDISLKWRIKNLRTSLPTPSRTRLNLGFMNRPENTNLFHKGKYRCTADLLLDWLSVDTTSKSVVHSTSAKQLNSNKINRRSAVQAKWILLLEETLVIKMRACFTDRSNFYLDKFIQLFFFKSLLVVLLAPRVVEYTKVGSS